MDLKTKLMIQAGINEDIAIHIVKSLSVAEQKQLYSLDPVQLMQQIPDLMMDANINDEFEMEPKYQKQVPPKPRTDHLLKTGKYPQANHTSTAKSDSLEDLESSRSVKKYFLYIILGVTVFGAVSSFLPDEASPVIATKKIVQKPNKQKIEPKKIEEPKTTASTAILDLPPRGSWMFSPTAEYVSKLECKDQRFKNFNLDYTIELWLKVSAKIQDEVNLIELYSDNFPIERLFLNDEGQLCFSAGPGTPILKYAKSIPQNGKHYHLAVSKSGTSFKMFINGKLRKELQAQTSFPKSRVGIQLFRAIKNNVDLAIDEVRISSESIYNKDFIPDRTFSMSAITQLYMPLEKNTDSSLRFYGINHYKKSEPLTGGKWLNIIYETQVISNELEKLRSLQK